MFQASLVLLDDDVRSFIDFYGLSGIGVVDFLAILERVHAGTLGQVKKRVAKKTAKKRKVHRV